MLAELYHLAYVLFNLVFNLVFKLINEMHHGPLALAGAACTTPHRTLTHRLRARFNRTLIHRHRTFVARVPTRLWLEYRLRYQKESWLDARYILGWRSQWRNQGTSVERTQR